jgi:lactate permease
VVEEAISSLGVQGDAYRLALSAWSAIPNTIACLFVVFFGVCMLVKLFGPEKSFKPALAVLPFCLFTSCVYLVPYVISAVYLGPEFPALFAAIVTLPIIIAAIHHKVLIPKTIWSFKPKESWDDSWKARTEITINTSTKMSLLRAWMPYIIIPIILVLTRLPFLPLKGLMTSPAMTFTIPTLFGIEGLTYSWKIINNPGLIPFIFVVFIAFFIHHVTRSDQKKIFIETFRQLSGAAIALLFGFALVQLYRFSNFNSSGMDSMLIIMAQGVAGVAGSLYFVVSPFIGILGSFISGSATVSNILFSSLQFETAFMLGLPTILIIALQSMGSAVGNMICVNNIVAACATCGTIGSEGKLLRTNIVPCLIYTCIVTCIVGLLIVLGYDPLNALIDGGSG